MIDLSRVWESRERRLIRAFKSVFNEENEDALLVLRHLARTCHAYSTTLSDTPERTAAAEGRRQVWLEIQELAALDSALLMRARGYNLAEHLSEQTIEDDYNEL